MPEKIVSRESSKVGENLHQAAREVKQARLLHREIYRKVHESYEILKQGYESLTPEGREALKELAFARDSINTTEYQMEYTASKIESVLKNAE
jgi:hypothetical protein